jgi:hypothetical protein
MLAYCHDDRPPLFVPPADRPEKERSPERTVLPDPAAPPRPDATHPMAAFYRRAAPCRYGDCSDGELPEVASAGQYL